MFIFTFVHSRFQSGINYYFVYNFLSRIQESLDSIRRIMVYGSGSVGCDVVLSGEMWKKVVEVFFGSCCVRKVPVEWESCFPSYFIKDTNYPRREISVTNLKLWKGGILHYLLSTSFDCLNYLCVYSVTIRYGWGKYQEEMGFVSRRFSFPLLCLVYKEQVLFR